MIIGFGLKFFLIVDLINMLQLFLMLVIVSFVNLSYLYFLISAVKLEWQFNRGEHWDSVSAIQLLSR